MIETYMVWIWLAVFIITLIVEAFTLDLVSIWFSLGSLVGIILSLVTNIPYYYEILIFTIISFVFLILTRPLVVKFFRNENRATNVDEFIGKDVIIISDITKFEPGTMKINGILYTAILPEQVDYDLKKGELARIIAFKGNKAVVKKINKEEN